MSAEADRFVVPAIAAPSTTRSAKSWLGSSRLASDSAEAGATLHTVDHTQAPYPRARMSHPISGPAPPAPASGVAATPAIPAPNETSSFVRADVTAREAGAAGAQVQKTCRNNGSPIAPSRHQSGCSGQGSRQRSRKPVERSVRADRVSATIAVCSRSGKSLSPGKGIGRLVRNRGVAAGGWRLRVSAGVRHLSGRRIA